MSKVPTVPICAFTTSISFSIDAIVTLLFIYSSFPNKFSLQFGQVELFSNHWDKQSLQNMWLHLVLWKLSLDLVIG